MALEHFKKQVLLLHSEQSTLDDLSAGFNDRYTVHCATSGSEALNTLGDIQIDIIVTAQDLPGMSGLDALREAKKRSPETIGILLAGDESNGLEALVGDQEVFQIVRGEVTPDSLNSLIDNATRQARLTTLAESANDTMARPDEPSGEHIVMETSENGSTIISDGTGRLPVLDPKKVSAAVGVGARAVDVLVLTRDEEFLATVQESARGLHNIIYANTLAQADEAIRNNKVGVAVVDAAMVGEKVEKLTMHLRATSPRLVAIVAGRRDDGEMLMDLINRGKVYRFLLKPVSPGRSRLAIEASVKHHLEAPDSAFRVAGAAAATIAPVPNPAAKVATAPKSVSKPAAVSEAAVAKAPIAQPTPASKAPAKARSEPTPPIVPKRDESLSPSNEGLTESLGGGDTRFTETVAGIVDSVGQTFASLKKKASDPEATMVATDVPAAVSSGGAGGSLLSSPKLLGIGATAVVVIGILTFWLLGGSDDQALEDEALATTTSAAEANPVFESEVVSPQDVGLNDLIDEAKLAATAGQVFNPPGSNAIELYLSALDVAPGDPVAEVGLQQVIEQALGMAETALLERRPEDAAAALQRVELANPENPRLPFLNAQLEQMQLRDNLDDARLAVRESRFEDAQLALSNASALTVPDTTEIDVVRNELNAALSEQHVDEVLAKANMRLDEGLLVAPSNDNARYYYELALSNDPDNNSARQGLNVVASKLVLQAREQIDAGNFQVADALLADARRLDPSSNELSASTAALQTAREQRTQDVRRVAEQQAAAERAAAEQAAAEQAAAEQAALEQAAKQESTAEQATAVALVEDAPSADAEPELVAADAEPALTEPVDEPQAIEPQPAAAVTPVAQKPVPVSSLKRNKYVAPKYPRTAQRRSLSGWVDIVFTVDIDGTVSDIDVRDSNPGETFVDAASNAVEQWEFEPVIENGVAIQQRAAVRMMFAIE